MHNSILTQILFELKKQYKNDIAFLIHNTTVYYAHHIQTTNSPTTAITKLIQGISEFYKENAHFMLRNRIYCSYAPQQKCLGMIKVAAKRFTFIEQYEYNASALPYTFVEVKYNFTFTDNPQIREYLSHIVLKNDNDCMQLALSLKEKGNNTFSLSLSDRKIAAILVDAQYQLLAYGLNSNSTNRTRHAEINLIYQYFHNYQQKIPANTKLFTSLKPCIMCANMIWECAEDITQVKVFYHENDYGSYTKNTVLDKDFFAKNQKNVNTNLQKTHFNICEHFYSVT